MKIEQRFGVYDIESRDWVKFEVMGFFDGTQYRTFENVKKFLDALNRKGYDGMRFYGHNAGKFDVLFLLEALLARGWVEKIIDIHGRIVMLKCRTQKATFFLCDSYALLPLSLQKLSDGFKPEHRKGEGFDYKKVHKRDPRTLRYLENDVFCLYEVLKIFQASNYIDGEMRLTIASQAMNVFKNHFLPHEIVQMEVGPEEDFRERFYAGGRVEVYKGGGTVNCYDVNSLFPNAMLQEMPCGRMSATRTFQADKIGFYTVDIKRTPDWYVSPLLVKGKKNLFVNGPGRYNLSSAMLLHLRRTYGLRFEVVSGYVFSRREDLFQDYVSTFYKIKQDSKGTPQYQIAKLMLNSLYGKFAQKRWQDAVVLYENGMTGFDIPDSHLLAEYGFVLVKEQSRSKFIMPAIAAHVTDLARLQHFKLMEENPEAMFYCDTDSLYTSADMSKKVSEKIGGLSFLGKWKGIFLNSKTYALQNKTGEKIAFKGFDAREFSFADFVNVIKSGKPLVQEKDRVLGYREAIRRTKPIKFDAGKYLKAEYQTKQAVTSYDKRLTFKSRKHIFDSKPFTFQQSLEKGK